MFKESKWCDKLEFYQSLDPKSKIMGTIPLCSRWSASINFEAQGINFIAGSDQFISGDHIFIISEGGSWMQPHFWFQFRCER